MRKLVLMAAALIGAAASPASAQVDLDMNRITCGDWVAYDKPTREFLGYWMSGYYSADRNDNVLDFGRLRRNAEKVLSYCKKHKADSLPKAINKLKS